MARPRLMILDEPTAALAPARGAESFARIRGLPALYLGQVGEAGA